MEIKKISRVEGLHVVEYEKFIEHESGAIMEYVLLLNQSNGQRELGSARCDFVSWDETNLLVESKDGQYNTNNLIEVPMSEISHLELWSNGYWPTNYVGIVLKEEV